MKHSKATAKKYLENYKIYCIKCLHKKCLQKKALKVPSVKIEVKISQKCATCIKTMRRNKVDDYFIFI